MSNNATNQYIRQVLHAPEPPPAANARFFYTSTIPIDDPLSPLPPPVTNASTLARVPPTPFSDYDNEALDKAWHDLRRQILKYNEERGEKGGSNEGGANNASVRLRKSSSTVRAASRADSSSRPGTPQSKPTKSPASNLSHVRDVDEASSSENAIESSKNVAESVAHPHTTGTPFIRAPSRKKVELAAYAADDRQTRPKMTAYDTYQWEDPSHLVDHRPKPPEKKDQSHTSPSGKVAVGVSRLHQVEMPDLQMTPIYWAPVHDTAQVLRGTWFYQDTMLPVETDVANMLEAGYIDLQVWTETWKDELDCAIEVGAIGEMKIVHDLWPKRAPPKASGSRPTSQQRPINEREENLLRTATTTFFENEQETLAADQRRAAAVEAACDIIDIANGPGGPDNKASGACHYGRQGALRTYEGFGVIYANEREARILKPVLLPSAYYGRRPLANYIRKGHNIGIPVVRGFDSKIWEKLHPRKKNEKAKQAGRGATSSAAAHSGGPKDSRKRDPTLSDSERPGVTDLVFVIHGIGQKLSERMESFHFTHAINAFRREVMTECGSKEIKTKFREDMGGIMVLPINWRHSLSFEEGGYRPDDGERAPPQDPDPAVNDFSLQDITPDTLPSVRGIVSDVMLDIPYYMSDHQPKMISAVIREANRVYSLWCYNNPGFAEKGRVHIIAHSLGSVMAIDILSKQPTFVPPQTPTSVPPSDSRPSESDRNTTTQHLLFNTHNLFLAGSPAGFFLLLRKAQLKPRIDHPSAHTKFPSDPSATNIDAICGHQGQYGCISVHNVYNIVNGYDPVAYQMNGTVDAKYAAFLRKFFIPSNTPGYWFASGSSTSTRWFGGSAAPAPAASSPSSRHPPTRNDSTTVSHRALLPTTPAAHPDDDQQSPPILFPRLPSQVELETHNFTHEQLAENRMRLLNDNGQIDFFLKYGGGTFEIQYLTMLGAHSAYWGLHDFIRFVVVEVGRAEGVKGRLPGLRAGRGKARTAVKGR